MRREDEPEEFAIAEEYFRELRTWLKFRDSHDPWMIAPESRMALDDQLTRPHHVSHNTANAVSSAIDHLHTLDSIMIGASASHPLAPFSLIRGAIESAAQAAWIVSPEEQQQRIARSLSASLKDAKDRAMAYAELGRQYPQPGTQLPDFENDKAKLQKIHDTSGSTGKLVLPTSTGILKEVRYLAPNTSALSIWQLCSGFAHGRRWASDAVFTPTATTSLPGDAVSKVNRPTMKTLVWALTPAMDLIRYTITRYSDLANP